MASALAHAEPVGPGLASTQPTTSATPFLIEVVACAVCGAAVGLGCTGVRAPALEGLAEVHRVRFEAYDRWTRGAREVLATAEPASSRPAAGGGR